MWRCRGGRTAGGACSLWFPSSLAEPLSPSTRDSMGFGASTDPELEFDQEVYPIGISLSDVAILGAARGPPAT